MGAPEFAIPIVEDALRRAADQGESMTIAALQEAAGVGREDLEATLEELTKRGEAVEEAPGEWRAPYEDERRDQRKPDEPDGRDERVRAALDGPAPRAGEAVLEGARALAGGGGEVVLTSAMANALGAETLGELVKAGIAEAAEQAREFVLVVRP